MQKGDTTTLVTLGTHAELSSVELPKSIAIAGPAASFAWDEFFGGRIRNPHTRKAYLFAIRRFMVWCESRSLELSRITPGMVGRYFDEHPGSVPTKKLHMAGIRGLFDVLVERHVIILNPTASVRMERFSAVEGRTPTITVEQARQLLACIDLKSVVDYRDRAIIGTLIYTAVRAGAIARLGVCDLVDEGTQRSLWFYEKGGKARVIPVRHDLQIYLQEYCHVASLDLSAKYSPLFRSAIGKSGRLSERGISGIDICRMVKRRLSAAKLPTNISPHSFRSLVATDLLANGVPLETVQYLLGHADSRTTGVYDRRHKQVTRNIVERISV